MEGMEGMEGRKSLAKEITDASTDASTELVLS